MSTIGLIGLKILLKHGHFIALPMEPKEAERIMDMWTSGQLNRKIGSHNVHCPPGFMKWVVEGEEIVGIHSFDLAEAQQGGQMTAQGYQPWKGRSGL